jgi:hypothetical protein
MLYTFTSDFHFLERVKVGLVIILLSMSVSFPNFARQQLGKQILIAEYSYTGNNSTAVECSISMWSMLYQMLVCSERKADDYIVPEILVSSIYGCYMLHSSMLCKQTNGYQCCYVPTDCPSVLYL